MPPRPGTGSLVWLGALARFFLSLRMKDQMMFICKIFLGIGVTFRDESNDVN